MIETTSKTKLYGILGTPIGHTISPAMHSYMAAKNGLNMAYLPFDVQNEQLPDVIKGIKAMGACGFNITAPHKINVMKHLDVISPDAKRMNSVNTIVNRNGVWHGFNTDGDGFCGSLQLEGVAIKNKHILMMGAGGSARSLCYKLAQHGAASITLTPRSKDKIHIIGDMVTKYTDTRFLGTISEEIPYDIIINTTPVGMHPLEDQNPCDFMERISKETVCCDIIYNPQKTVFLQEAQKRGAKIINGLGMLILQGILAFEYFTDKQLDHAAYYEELMQLFREYRI